MCGSETFTLEYWIELAQFSKEHLKNHVNQSLGGLLADTKFEVQEKANYLILRIVSTEKIIDGCHDKLGFNREWSFRAKDELGNLLRSKAYSVLAEIELRLRNFISQAMIDVVGFDWWNSFITGKLREKVEKTESKARNQVKFHHSIEFTFFEDLISVVTTKFQAWTDEKNVTAVDLYELLSTCSSIEDIHQEIKSRRKIVSFWDDVFSDYFDDKNSWTQLEKNIETRVIPIRNKVMHHRLVRCHELQQLKDFRDELGRVLDLAKPTLSDVELEESKPNVKIIVDRLRHQFDPEAFRNLTPAANNLEAFRKLMQPASSLEAFRNLTPAASNLEAFRKLMQPASSLDIINKPRLGSEFPIAEGEIDNNETRE